MLGVSQVREWLRRIIRRILGRPEPKPEELVKEYIEDVKRVVRPRPSSRGIQRTDLGMRKVARHGRRGRQFERRSGVDHSLRMEEVEKRDREDDKKRKKKTWFEDRKKRDG